MKNITLTACALVFIMLDLPFKIGQPGHAERVRLARSVDYSKPLGEGPLGAGFDFYFGDDVINQPLFLWIEDNRSLTLPTLPNHPKILRGSSNGPCTPDWDQAKVLPKLIERAVDYLRKRGTGKDQLILLALRFPLTLDAGRVVSLSEETIKPFLEKNSLRAKSLIPHPSSII